MALLDPRGLTPGDYKSASVGGLARKHNPDMDVVLVRTPDGDVVEVFQQNVNDILARGPGWQKLGPKKAAKTAAVTEDPAEAVLTEATVDQTATPAEPNELDLLKAEAAELGIDVHPQWGKRSLQKAIDTANARANKAL